MINLLSTILIFIIIFVLELGIIKLFSYLNIRKENRYLQKKHLIFLIFDIIFSSILFTIIYFISGINQNAINELNESYIPQLLLSIVILIYLVFKSIYRIYFDKHLLKNNNFSQDILPKEYYRIDNSVYIHSKYFELSIIFKLVSIIILIILDIIVTFLYFINNIDYLGIISITEITSLIIIFFSETSFYLDGICEKTNTKNTIHKRNTSENDFNIESINNEYYKLWKDKLLGTFEFHSNHKSGLIETTNTSYESASNIAYSISNDKINNFLYTRILFPIINSEDIIIESSLLDIFSQVIVPIINILFATNKKLLFICDNYTTVLACKKWLEQSDIKINSTNSNLVVDVLSYESNISIKSDNNVDIYIGTIDLILENKFICDNIDVVFGFNVDNIISENALHLNLLSSVLSNNNVQYILFGNRVNGLRQVISQIFMRNNFKYQIIYNTSNKNFYANLWSIEDGWFQSTITHNTNQYLGQLLPLSIPCFKYGIKNINIVSSADAFQEQLLSFQTTLPLLSKYIGSDIINIDDTINCSQNENFIKIDDNSVVMVYDYKKNISLVIQDYIKYSKSNMLLNIVSPPYILRDYITSNIDFFVGNAEMLSDILPIPKNNVKISLYRIINLLCYDYIEEDVLLREIQKINNDINIDTFKDNQIHFIIDTLNTLTKKVFGVDISFSSYLKTKKVYTDKINKTKYFYKLLDSVIKELPEYLFKNVVFIDSEQKAKIIKKIPTFELYQNYLEGQYIVLNEKCYLINKIDFNNSTVELVNSNNYNNVYYRQCRSIENISNKELVKEAPNHIVRGSTLTKKIIYADFTVNTVGYYEFKNNISFANGEYSYKKLINSNELRRNYKLNNILSVNISSRKITSMSDIDKFKISFTLSLLLNEIFETLFSTINHYVLVRNVVNDKKVYSDFNREEIIKLYKPIEDNELEDGINIYIIEDTELEKGIIDSINNNFDNLILKLLYDYLFWLLKEENNVKSINKMAFLKYGKNNLSKCLDFEKLYDVLKDLIVKDNNNFTENRLMYINKFNEEKPTSTKKKTNKEKKSKNKNE